MQVKGQVKCSSCKMFRHCLCLGHYFLLHCVLLLSRKQLLHNLSIIDLLTNQIKENCNAPPTQHIGQLNRGMCIWGRCLDGVYQPIFFDMSTKQWLFWGFYALTWKTFRHPALTLLPVHIDHTRWTCDFYVLIHSKYVKK